jgi:hypothetical protein
MAVENGEKRKRESECVQMCMCASVTLHGNL